ncbi:hypothetical protein HW115_13115 [Verrucomicrobiaceae bacterium N1E253]|uniref:Carbohydrate-binding family V/XII n=1 Tax=Oceaniferula marina TaxID=2748318 RepID=A0A851GN43_9BACT|nr:hypothetical protein [Oceaniferula marina]NWK56555.1 hypothetical protein [Oceaniferula marina]
MKTMTISNLANRLPYRNPYPWALCAALASTVVWLFSPLRAADEKTPTPAAAAEVDLTESTYPQVFDAKTHEITKYQPQIDEWKDFKLLKARMAVAIQKKGSEEEPKYISIEFEADTVADREENVVHIGPRRLRKLIFVDAKDAAEEAELKKILALSGDGQTPLKVNLDDMVASVEHSEVMNRDIKVNLDPPPIFYSEEPAIMVTFMGEPDFKAIDPKTNKVLFALNTNWDLLMDVESSTYYLLIEDGWIKTQDILKGPWSVVDSLPASFSKLPDDENWSDVRAALKAEPFEAVPKVFVSKQPGELIETEGKPNMTPISGTKLLFISNTESDVFFLSSDSYYYYLVEGRWFKSKTLTGGWVAATLDLPDEFAKIPEDHEKGYVLASVQGSPVAEEAAVLAAIPETATMNRDDATLTVSYDGEPQFEPIKGSSDVQYAINTENDVFLTNGKYYCCYQGVWFVGSSPNGPWALSDEVDKNIYTIPADNPQHNVTYVQVYNSTPTTVQYGYTSGYTGQYLFRGLLVFGAGYWLGHNSSHHHYHWYRPSYIGWGCGARWGWHGGYHRPCRWGYGPYGGCVRPVHYHRHGGYRRPVHYHGHHRPGHHRPGYNPWKPGHRPGHGNRPGHRPIARPMPYGSWGDKAKLDNRMARDRYNKARDKSLRPVTRPSTRPNLRPGTRPGGKPGTGPVARPGTRPGTNPGTKPGTRPGTNPGTKPGTRPGVTPGRPSTQPVTRPSTRPDVYVGKDGKIYKKDKGGQWQQRDKSGWKDTKIADRPSTRPGNNPSTRPSTRPGNQPSTRPSTKPSTRPSTKPSTRPSTKPSTRPSTKPSTRPSTKPSTRPSTKPSTRPSTKPSTRPSTKPTYKSTRSNGSKLHHDSRSRSRASSSRPSYSHSKARSSSSSRSARSRTSSSRSRSSGGSRGGGGGRRR